MVGFWAKNGEKILKKSKNPVVTTVDKKGGFGYKFFSYWSWRNGLDVTEDFPAP